MNQYDDVPMAAEPEPDPRVIAMQRVVDLEKQAEFTSREAEERQKRAAIVREELSAARDDLFGMLGLPSRSGQKPMSGEDARAIAAERYAR